MAEPSSSAANEREQGVRRFRESVVPALLSTTASVLMSFHGMVAAREPLLPDNPLHGAVVFVQKGCIKCHPIHGEGGQSAPDLGRRQFQGGYLGLAQLMWNHFPDMESAMRERGSPTPTFSRSEIDDLFAYLLYVPYLGESGDAQHGKMLLSKKNCVKCHGAGQTGEETAPDLTAMVYYGSPLYLIREMWNHGPLMQRQLQKKGMTLPQLSGAEMTDIAAYLQSVSGGGLREAAFMKPGNAKVGAAVFRAKHCSDCHLSAGGSNVSPRAPDLSRTNTPQTITEIAGTMWNHIGVMSERMAAAGIVWPRFTLEEMSDLIAYIYFLRFSDPAGDSRAGSQVFLAKNCAVCHSVPGSPADSTKHSIPEVDALTTMVMLMWNHAPQMDSLIHAAQLNWPEFTLQEMTDLYSYLREATVRENER